MNKNIVSVFQMDEAKYPVNAAMKNNPVYEAVLESWHLLGLDDEHYGLETWNPLADFIKPGMKVVVKPNLGTYSNQIGAGEECLYVQSSVLVPIIDYVRKALAGTGKIMIADAASWNYDLKEHVGYGSLMETYRPQGIEFLNLQRAARSYDDFSLTKSLHEGEVMVNLGENSEFSLDDVDNLRCNINHREAAHYYHNQKNHVYVMAKSVLDADVIINVVKPKTHESAGVTLALKNFVGTITCKQCLPHFSMEELENKSRMHIFMQMVVVHMFRGMGNCIGLFGYLRKKALLVLHKFLLKNFSDMMHQAIGHWYGNTTLAKGVLDINKIVIYADKNGIMQDIPQRQQFIVADMVIAGQKEGPVKPSPKKVGIIASGFNPVLFDEVMATLMGFDVAKIPHIAYARKLKKYLLCRNEVGVISSNNCNWQGRQYKELRKEDTLGFVPSFGWNGHIEL